MRTTIGHLRVFIIQVSVLSGLSELIVMDTCLTDTTRISHKQQENLASTIRNKNKAVERNFLLTQKYFLDFRKACSRLAVHE